MKMKILALASVVALFMTACSGSSKSDSQADSTAENTPDETEAVVETYTGVLPQADGSGIAYTVTLTYDADGNGQYQMVQVYDDQQQSTFNSTGTFTSGQQNGTKYLKLQNQADSTDVYYFLDATPDSITMVGMDLTVPVTGNYTLTKK